MFVTQRELENCGGYKESSRDAFVEVQQSAVHLTIQRVRVCWLLISAVNEAVPRVSCVCHWDDIIAHKSARGQSRTIDKCKLK